MARQWRRRLNPGPVIRDLWLITGATSSGSAASRKPHWCALSDLLSSFCPARFDDGDLNLFELCAKDVTVLVQNRAHQLSRGRAKLLVTALRSLLRYMRHQREIPLDLARCVLPVAMWSLSTLPRFLPAGTVQQLLDHHERETPRGKRNYAVLLLLARLGLRAFEIVALGLDDIDWDNGRITIHGKVDAWPRCRCHPTSVKPSQAICARPAMLYLSPSFPSTSSPRAWFCTLHHRLQHRETGADRGWRRFCSQGSAQD